MLREPSCRCYYRSYLRSEMDGEDSCSSQVCQTWYLWTKSYDGSLSGITSIASAVVALIVVRESPTEYGLPEITVDSKKKDDGKKTGKHILSAGI